MSQTEEKRLQIDARIHELEVELLALKQSRNTLVPACNLPHEVLSQLFLELRDALESKQESTWTTVTRVCSVWRTVALSFPALWDSIKLRSIPAPPFTQQTLALAADRPLRIDMYLDGGSSLTNQLPAGVLSRVTDLNLHDYPLGLNASCGSNQLYKPAPRLKNLYIRGITDPRSDASPRVFPSIFPGSLANRAPSLQKATLETLRLRWDSLPFLNSVVVLELTSCSLWGSLEEMFAAINKMQNLEELCMDVTMALDEDSIPHWEPGGTGTGRIFLPKLKKFTFSSEAEWTDELLRALDAPSLVECSIWIVDNPFDETIILAVAFFRRYLQHWATSRRGSPVDEILISSSELQIFGSGSEPVSFFYLSVANNRDTPDWIPIFLADGPDLDQVGSLSCCIDEEDITLQKWKSLAQRLTTLHTLYFQGYEPTEAAPHLFIADIESGPYFPALKTVELGENVCVKHATTWLRTRKERGFAVEVLRLAPELWQNPEDVARLQEVVPFVDVMDVQSIDDDGDC